MDQIFNELHHIHTNHYQALQERSNDVQMQCEEVDSLRAGICVVNYSSCVPTGELEGILAEAAKEFPQKIHTLHQAEQAEKAFRTTHSLDDKTAEPNVVVSILLITISVFVDASVNSSFLYNAHMVAGPFAALLVSFLISLTNVTISACAGYFIGRFLNYGSNITGADAAAFKTIRDRAKWQFRVFIGVMAFFILTVGLIRSTESLDRIGHSLAHYHELLVTPEAIFLVLLNICIAVFAYHKGRTGFAHPYGGYSERQKGVIAARDDLHGSYTGYVEEIKDVCADAESDVKAQIKAQEKPIERYNKEARQCRHECRELEQAVHTAKSGLSAAATKLVHTLSVISGKSESIPDSLLEQFSFSDITMPNPPAYYRPSNDSNYKAALDEAEEDALKRLSEIFKHTTQS